ncbi:B12-binding domain-containing radical SAM protein [Candidatus Fermentibacteria bacterium]|nr:B12-binding domain-containing radical SAM protein [Candidatus Fermentibacteria bacterium]
MKLLLIRPPVIHHRGDFYGSIPGIPIGIAHLAAVVQAAGHPVAVLDAYGSAPRRLYSFARQYVARGLTPSEIVRSVTGEIDAIGLSVHCTTEQAIARALLSELRDAFPGMPLIVGGYHPTFVPEQFVALGADFVVLGEGEHRLPALLDALEGRGSLEEVEGLATGEVIRPRTKLLGTLDGFPLPAAELLPLENYWKLPYGHGPVRGPYMNVITSRGCPFHCGFCQAPLMSGGKWLARSPDDVLRELVFYHDRWGITDFHIQDENFALNRARCAEICREVIRLGRGFTFCLPSGINAMTLNEELVDLMARAGFRYLSVSPETGSPRVLELMGKRMDLSRVSATVAMTSKRGIRTNACFMLGYPGEEDEDRAMTRRYVAHLARQGLDELIIPIMTPFPGTASMEAFPGCEAEEMCFSPRWRKDYRALSRFRTAIYAMFLTVRAFHRPGASLRQIANVLTRRHETKGEMTVTRVILDAVDWRVRRPLRALLRRDAIPSRSASPT